MASALRKDTLRTIARERKRFISILLICVLGTTMVCGLRAACVDLRQSADAFFSQQGLYDLRIQSTLGLTDEDVEAVAALSDVEEAAGAYEETTYTQLGSKRASVGVKALQGSFNQPYLLEGRLPEAANEVAVTQNYLTDSGAQIGSTVSLEPGDSEVFTRTEYRIVGTVIDPTELTNPNGSIAVRASASPDYQFFTTADAVCASAYTVLYVHANNPQGAAAYSEEYKALLGQVEQQVLSVKEEREQARSQHVRQEALSEIAKQEQTANSELANAQEQLDGAQATIDSGKQEIAANRAKMQSGAAQIAESQEQIAQQESQLNQAEAQINDGYAQIESGLAQITSGREQLERAKAQANSQCDQAIAQVDAAYAAGAITEEEHAAQVQAIEQQRSQALEPIAQQEQQLNANEANLQQERANLDAKAAEVAAGKQAIEAAKAQIAASAAELDQGRSQLSAAEGELASGQAELDANKATFEDQKAEAQQKIADARADVDTLEDARWYVQTRESNTGYASVESDAGSIEAIGYVFPVVFIVVAVLIALTTITRLVEEERGLIGTYKSLGYSNRAILGKYLVYALLACLVGGALGEVCGFVLFPTFLFSVFQVMYLLPNYLLSFDALYGIGGIAFFVVGIAGAAVLACRSELRQTPAMLMRPKAPPAGSRIFLERIGFIWKKMSFLNKVTARNILRYKKRFFMTIFGIMGCMALLICGFAIRDSVHALSPLQYGGVYRYDVQAVVSADSFDDAQSYLQGSAEVSQLQPIAVDTVTVSTAGDEESMQLFVVPDGADISPYLSLASGDESFALDGSGMILTRNAAELLGVQGGSTAHLKTSKLDEADAAVAHVADNYLGNAAYVSQSTYRQLFGKEASPNGFYLNLAEGTDASAFADSLAEREEFLSVTSTQQMNDEFAQSFALINTIVYVIVGLAAALAFVVLFTLSTTNISERIRELATIKVLGFRAREVNHYVNKETILLTAIGMLLGIPAGYAFSHSLTYVLKMPSIYFAVTIEPGSYLIACALTLLFAVIVALLSNRSLKKINMIEALKSVE